MQPIPKADPDARKSKTRSVSGAGFDNKALGGDLLLHRLSDTTIGAAAFHFCVREGNRWDHCAMAAKETAGVALVARTRMG